MAEIATSTATVETHDGPMDLYVAEPAGSAKAPAVIVLQEIFGVEAHIQSVCQRFAAEGFVAAAPELFHRAGRGIVLGHDQMQRAVELLAQLTNEALEMDLRAALASLRGHRRCDGRVAAVGFCAGGFAAFLAACKTDVDATVVFYGGGIVHERPQLQLKPLVEVTGQIRRPVLCLFGGKDGSIPAADVAEIQRRLAQLNVRAEVHVYPDAGHAFFNDARSTYVPAAAADAWKRTLGFLRAVLGGASAQA